MPCETAKLLLSEGITETCMSLVLADSARAFCGLGVEKHCCRCSEGWCKLTRFCSKQEKINPVIDFLQGSCMYCNALKLPKISLRLCVWLLLVLLLRPTLNVMFPKTKCQLVAVSTFIRQVFVGPAHWVIFYRGGIPMQVELLAVKCAKIKAIEVAELTIFLPQQIYIQPNS